MIQRGTAKSKSLPPFLPPSLISGMEERTQFGTSLMSVSWEMKPLKCVSLLVDPCSRRSCLCILLPTASLLCLVFFIGSAFLAQDHKEILFRWGIGEENAKEVQNCTCEVTEVQNDLKVVQNNTKGVQNKTEQVQNDVKVVQNDTCKSQSKPPGSESLPKGIISNTSNLEMRPLWGTPKKRAKSANLFCVAVGIKQKELVDKMVKKFLSSDFVVMLFHYDGVVDEWRDLEWSDRVVHISALNQTKWWFAKRFLHPDIVAEYSYIFLWDEDLGLDNFNPERYLQIVKDEGLEISQPALDPGKSEMHHQITVRSRRSNVHRRIYKSGNGAGKCGENSTAPPCTGWIEVMAPVFSRASWRCVWYMVQNDLIHAWGLDMQLGYCAQGDRTKNIGVVDSEYIVHYGFPTLGDNKIKVAGDGTTSYTQNALPKSPAINYRVEVRRESYNEYKLFKRRWRRSAQSDECWIDPFPQPKQQEVP